MMRLEFRLFSSVLIGCFLSLLFSCIQDNAKDSDNLVNVDSILIDESASIDSSNQDFLFWEYDAEGDSMVKHYIPEKVSVETVLAELNGRYSPSQLDLIKISNDTMYVKIDDTSYLAQWGSTGNYGFLAEVVFSLTEVSDINYIFLDFEELDHASPGLYQRSDFK